jgi:hypothetical protein
MKWILIAGFALVALVGIVTLIGSRLPREHTASRTLRVKRSPTDVWAAVTQATSASGVPVDVLESVPPYRLVTRVKESEKMFGGTWTITIAPAPDSTGAASSTLTITEEGWVGNPTVRFVSRFLIGHHATMDGILKQVAKTLNEEAVLPGE